ncbi:MAG TPA: hypothetical protein VF753_21290 [Terriglobales bacterium]
MKLLSCLVLIAVLPLACIAQDSAPAAPNSPAPTQSQNSAQPPAAQTAPQSSAGNAPTQSPAPSAPQTSTSPTQPQSNPPAPQPQDKDKATPQTSGKVAGTSNDRLFYALPNFLTLETQQQLPPMTVGQKFKAVALGTFDYVQYPWWGILAAISQATDGHPAYGQGWEGYGKRYGTTAADSIIENFMVSGVFASMLRQDPRYYQLGQGSFFKRTGYSVSRIFVTRSDAGNKRFNFSEIFGAGTAAAISTYSYHPGSTYLSVPGNPHKFIASEKTFPNVASTWGTQVGLDTITFEIKEFWPDIRRKISKKHPAPAPAPGASGF